MDQAKCSELSMRKRTTINHSETIHATIGEPSEEDFDVLINFRGEDTRKNFVDNLYLCLTEAQPRMDVFMDEPSLPFGEEIEGKLLAAIERSKVAIVIISADYASSAYCLKELVHILRCMKTGRLKVIPVFYKIDPSDVRNLTNSFERIQTHIMKYHGAIVESWKDALISIGKMKGFVVDDTSFQGRIVRSIVDKVKLELKIPCKMNFNLRPQRTRNRDHLVGIDEKAREIMGVISEDTIDGQIVEIYGKGGIGKAALTRYMVNHCFNTFHVCMYVTKAQETMPTEVSSEQLISFILEQGRISSDKGMDRIRRLPHKKKVIIVLDDIDSRIQMRTLTRICSFVGFSSNIILTTRNMGVFSAPEVTLKFELSELSEDQALKLFCKHAFTNDNPQTFEGYSNRVVEVCGGLPLALEVTGSYLFGKEEVEWKRLLKIIEDGPSIQVKSLLLLIYQALDNNQKQLFLDIAKFPNGFNKNCLLSTLEDADVEALDKLKAFTLVKFDSDNKLCMHDSLRDLASKILQVDGSAASGYCSHLWMDESRCMLKGSKEAFESTPSIGEAASSSTTELDKQGYFPEVQTERVQTTAIAKGEEPMVALEEPWTSRHEFGESPNATKLQRGKHEAPLQFNGRIENTSAIRRNSMEADPCLSQPTACLDRLFGEINSMLTYPQYTMEEKLPYSTQETISLVDLFIKQIDLPDAADLDFTSASFLQSLESLRQPNALHQVPTELLMAFHSALTSFAGTPEDLDQIQSAKSTFKKCIRVQMAKEDEIQKLKFKLDMDKNALQKTQTEIGLLEDKLTSLKAKARDLETELTNAIPTVSALSSELKRSKGQLVEAQARFDNISILEEHVKTNHHRVLQLLHQIKNLLKEKT